MPVEFNFAPRNPVLSTHESLSLSFELRNVGSPPLEIPTPYDRSGSLDIGLHDERLGLLRTMNRITRQRLMSASRVDSSLDLDTLEPGQAWEWRMDLSSFGYPIPPGEFYVRPKYEYPPAGVNLRPEPRRIHVTEDPLLSISAVRDNPVLDSLTLLMEADTSDGTAYFLRQHNYNRPLGAWYSCRILNDDQPQDPFIASAAFFQTEEIRPAYRKWIVWTQGAAVQARRYQNGQPSDEVRSADLPEGASLIRSAVVTRDDKLYIFLWNAAGRLECHRLDQDTLEKIFEHQMRCQPGAMVSIGADTESVHIASHWRGLMYDRIAWNGKAVERFQVHSTRLKPVSIVYEPSSERIKALFLDAPRGRTLQMLAANLKRDQLSVYTMDRLPLREEVTELSFDHDRRNRFHLLAATSGRKLYYFSEERGPVLIAEGEERFFPIVVAPLKIYLGCYRREYGYRFLQYRRRRPGQKVLGLEPHPNLG
jgi:hypothetical protein